MNDPRSSRAGKARIGALGFTAIAIVLSILSAFLLYSLLAKKGYDQEAMRPIVVAVKPLEAGKPINQQHVILKPWPNQSIPNGAFGSIETLLKHSDKVPLHTILAGEAVVSDRLSSPKTGSGMAPLIPSNMRGFAVRADRWLTDAEMLYPGAVIDIVSSGKVKVQDAEGRRSREVDVSKIVLQKVKVVGVNGAVDGVRFSSGADGQQKQRASRGSRAVITLLVTPQQAEKLALAKGTGKLDFILRNTADDSVSETVGTNAGDLYNLPQMYDAIAVKDASEKSVKGKKGAKKARPRATMRRRASSRRKSASRKKPRKRTRSGELIIGN